MTKILKSLFVFFACTQVHAGPACTAVDSIQRELCEGTNEVRRVEHVLPLTSVPHLDQMASEYAQQLYLRNLAGGLYLSHDLPGYEFSKRMREGDVPLPCGENIAGGQLDAAAAVESWRESPGHHRNMVNSQYHFVGTGYSHGFWVQIFSN